MPMHNLPLTELLKAKSVLQSNSKKRNNKIIHNLHSMSTRKFLYYILNIAINTHMTS